MSIADGSFDGHFRRRFRGKGKTKKDGGQGFIIPTENEQLRFAETVKKYPNDVFEVESLSKENVRYVQFYFLNENFSKINIVVSYFNPYI